MPAFLRRPLTWFVIIGLIAGGGAVLWMNQSAKAKAIADKAKAAAPDSPYVAIANGKADVEGGVIQVAARTAGVVREVNVHEGDRVTKGEVLARQEDDQARLAAQTAQADVEQARAQVAAIEVQIATAHREYDRLNRLSASNFVARQALDQASDAIRTAEANLGLQRAAIVAAQARLAQAQYNEELTIIRAPTAGLILRRYANPGAGASTLNVSTMFDLEPDAPHVVRAEIAESAIPDVAIGQTAQLAPEADPHKVYIGRVLRRAGIFGARKLVSDDPNEATDARVVEVVVSADDTPFLVGQRVLVKFLKPGRTAAQAPAPAKAPAQG